MIARALSLAAVALLAATPVRADAPIAATYAAQDGRPVTAAYLRATPIDAAGRTERLDLWFTRRRSSTPLRDYQTDMTKKLHLIVVSSDFRHFDHIHPVLDARGHFTIVERFPAAGRYHIYADATLAGIGRQVQRFDRDVAGGGAATPVLAKASETVRTGRYTVTVDPLVLDPGSTTMLSVHVREGGMPARDLHPYLGALAHAVFINARDLSYAHAHPMAAGTDMSHMSMDEMMEPPELPDDAHAAPDMMLHVAVRDPGPYQLWLQFRGRDGLHVAPFFVDASAR